MVDPAKLRHASASSKQQWEGSAKKDYNKLCDERVATIQSARIDVSESMVTVAFEGARLLTLNDILSLSLRQRIRYKTGTHEAVIQAIRGVAASGRSPPVHIDKPCTLTLTRQVPSKNQMVDFEAMSAMFKFVLDALRYAGTLADDDPTMIVGVVIEQPIGPYGLALTFRNASQ